MREDVPVPPAEDLVAQMQGDRATSGGSTAFSFFFFFFANTQKVTDIDCVQSDMEQQQKQKVRVKWRERGETAELRANVLS